MKVLLGPNPNIPEGFRLLGKSGADITEEFDVISIKIEATTRNFTKVTLEVYGEAEAEFQDLHLTLDGPNREDPSTVPG